MSHRRPSSVGLSDELSASEFAFNCGCPSCVASHGGGVGDPVSNGAAQVPASFDARVDGLLSGYKWAVSSVRYADPDSRFDYEAGHVELFSDFERIGPEQRAAVHRALDAASRGGSAGHAGFSVEGFTNLGVTYAGSGGVAEIRFANTADPGTAYAYYPGGYPEAGDVFFGGSGRSPVAGGYDHATILHETGHALGLKHGHEGDVIGAVPHAYDSMEYSVMTYRSHVGASVGGGFGSEAFGYAQTFMMLDIAALQHMYGADFTTNAGNTTYSWSASTGRSFVNGEVALSPGENRIFQTIWDGGGTDAYDLSNYASDLAIDLAPGRHSTFSDAQRSHLGGGPNGGYARGNVFNALQHKGDPRSLIENALGGSGDDLIRGNAADNRLSGGAGEDRLDGDRGSDDLSGGAGGDRLLAGSGADRLEGGGGADVLTGGAGCDVLLGGRGSDVFRFLSAADFGSRAPDLIRGDDGAGAFGGAGERTGDRIDLAAIDANEELRGRQSFAFGEAGGAGRLWAVDAGGNTHIRGSLDGGPGWDFELVIADRGVLASAYSAADFIGVA